jgi:hypothetical protein
MRQSPQFQYPVPDTPADAIAANILAIRAARRAIVKNPDHPLAYQVLGSCHAAQACPMPGFGANSVLQMITAYRRYLDRIPLPAAATDRSEIPVAARVAEMLANFYGQPQAPVNDLFRDAMRLSMEYQMRGLMLAPAATEAESQEIKTELEKLQKRTDALDQWYAGRYQRFSTSAGAPIKQRLDIALNSGLRGEAMKLLAAADLDKEFGEQAPNVALLAVQLRLDAGMLEAAGVVLATTQERFRALAAAKPAAAEPINQALQQKLIPFHGLNGDDLLVARFVETNGLPPALSLTQKERLITMLQSREAYANFASGVVIEANAALGGPAAIVTLSPQRQLDVTVLQTWQAKSQAYSNVGIFYLLGGKNATARTWFEKALKPDGIPVPEYLTEQREVAERYLQIMKP